MGDIRLGGAEPPRWRTGTPAGAALNLGADCINAPTPAVDALFIIIVRYADALE